MKTAADKANVPTEGRVFVAPYEFENYSIYHFDLYRLENAGIKTITDELREYSEGKQLTFVEWAEFSQGEVPFDRIDINVTYDDDDNRCYTFKAEGEGKQDIIEGLKKC